MLHFLREPVFYGRSLPPRHANVHVVVGFVRSPSGAAESVSVTTVIEVVLYPLAPGVAGAGVILAALRPVC